MYLAEGLSYEEAVQAAQASTNLPWDTLKKAEGGIIRAGFPFGGQALKAIRAAWRANKDWGVGGPPYNIDATSFDIKKLTKRLFGEELNLTDLRRVSESPLNEKKVTFDQFNREFKNIKAQVLKEKLRESKIHAEAMIESADHTIKKANQEFNKAFGPLRDKKKQQDMAKRVTDQFTREGKQQLEEAKEGLKAIDIYMGMLQKKGRSVHAEGGRIGYAGGGKTGLPAITQGLPQGPGMQQPQMPAMGPQPAGIPGGTIVAQNQMQQAPWMGQNPMMGQGIGGQPRMGGQPRAQMAGGGMGRRAFMKMMAGLASLPFLGKGVSKIAPKAIPKVTETIVQSNAAGMPPWFPSLVKRVISEGEDISKGAGAMERQTVHTIKLPESGTPIEVTRDLVTDDIIVDIGIGKHGWDAGRHGQPARLELKKGEWIEPSTTGGGYMTKEGKNVYPGMSKGAMETGETSGKGIKTKDEFWVEEAEFTGGHPENIKFEEVTFEKYGNHASDFTEIEKYAVGKNIDKKIIGKKRAQDDWAEGRAQSQADEYDKMRDEGYFDEAEKDFYEGKASGGLAYALGE